MSQNKVQILNITLEMSLNRKITLYPRKISIESVNQKSKQTMTVRHFENPMCLCTRTCVATPFVAYI